MPHTIFKLHIVFICCCTAVYNDIAAVKAESPNAKIKMVKKEGLYSSSDNVIILNKDNTNDLVHGKSTAWVIQFYNGWCGHCIQFAPTWKTFATDLKGWRQVVSVGAIDCSTGENLRVCREFRIVAYPSILLVPANFSSYSSDSGHVSTLRGQQKNEMKAAILDYITHPQFPVPPSWPALHPARTMEEVREGVKQQSLSMVAVVLEEESSTVGLEVTLDLVDYPDVLVRRMVKGDHLSVKKLGNVKFPSVYRVLEDLTPQHLISGTGDALSDRRRFVDHLLSLTGHLDSQGQRLRGQGQGQTGEDEVRGEDRSEQSGNHTGSRQQQGETVRVYMEDLESTLTYSLRHEVTMHDAIQGGRLDALQLFLSVLAKYFPGRAPVRRLLQKLADYLRQTEVLTGEKWLTALTALQDQDSFLPDTVQWVGCEGSRPRYRGYPCGLWTLFHVLTVAAYQDVEEEASGVEVPLAIRGYMEHFFGCAECTRHFLSLASNLRTRIHKPVDAVLWLWVAHNKANRRLHGDVSEDPSHPKIQFPSAQSCPKCRPPQDSDSDSVPWWNSNAVLAFLLKVYGRRNLVWGGGAKMMGGGGDDDEKDRGENLKSGRGEGEKPGKLKMDDDAEEKDMDWWQLQRRKAETLKSDPLGNKRSRHDGGFHWEDVDSSDRKIGRKLILDPQHFPVKGGVDFRYTGRTWGDVDVGVYVVFYVACVVMVVALYYYFIVHKRSRGPCPKSRTV